jgi:hypothetical protein
MDELVFVTSGGGSRLTPVIRHCVTEAYSIYPGEVVSEAGSDESEERDQKCDFLVQRLSTMPLAYSEAELI